MEDELMTALFAGESGVAVVREAHGSGSITVSEMGAERVGRQPLKSAST
jgi:hypothetical protein